MTLRPLRVSACGYTCLSVGVVLDEAFAVFNFGLQVASEHVADKERKVVALATQLVA